MLNVSYAITVCNELQEITYLVDFLLPRIEKEDQIVIQYDEGGVTQPILDYLNIIKQIHKNIKVIGFPLNNDFASFKNNLKNHCDGIFIFQIDADEVPSEFLLSTIHELLEDNKEVDLFFVPRVNTVQGLTEGHIQKWGWKVNEKGHVNWPDLQTRLYRRTSEIEWVGHVHERIKGYNTLSIFPLEEEYSLYHHKDIERQERQNSYYNTL